MEMQMQMQIAPQVGCCKAIGLAFKNFGKCSGRSRRSEFWYFQLFVYAIDIPLYIITLYYQDNYQRCYNYDYEYGYNCYSKYGQMYNTFLGLMCLFSLIILIPYISLTVRRLHDIGQSGFLFLLCFIPLVGPFILLFLCCNDSQKNTNEYGPSPKYISPQDDPLNPNNGAYGVLVNPYPQPMPPQVPPYPQPNQMPPQVNPYPQPMPPQVSPYPQPNQMDPQVSPYPQPNQMTPQVNPYPQVDQMQPQVNPYPQVDPQISPNPQIPPPQGFAPY